MHTVRPSADANSRVLNTPKTICFSHLAVGSVATSSELTTTAAAAPTTAVDDATLADPLGDAAPAPAEKQMEVDKSVLAAVVGVHEVDEVAVAGAAEVPTTPTSNQAAGAGTTDVPSQPPTQSAADPPAAPAAALTPDGDDDDGVTSSDGVTPNDGVTPDVVTSSPNLDRQPRRVPHFGPVCMQHA